MTKKGDAGLNIKVNNCKNDNTIFNNKNWVEYTDEVKKALEKQVPKDVQKKVVGWRIDCFCPSCTLEVFSRQSYCAVCGQYLNWN